MLKINNLCVSLEEENKEILKGVNLSINPGEVHAIMGPNGSGKSTMSYVLAGKPGYEVTSGSVQLDNVDILELEPEERAYQGLFLAFQYPVEIPGVGNMTFLRTAVNSQRKAKKSKRIKRCRIFKISKRTSKFARY
jgi:Fe-S cluster assembly ATP-binding protein